MKNKVESYFKRILAIAFVTICFTLETPIATIQAATTGGSCLGWVVAGDTAVYEYPFSNSSRIGTVFNGEGVTVLDSSGDYYKIQYTTSSGAKSGYVLKTSLWTDDGKTTIGTMRSNQTVYYGKSTSGYQSVGSVNNGELVAVLASDSNWTYIEYDTSSKRKRGYVPTSSVFFVKPSGMQSYYRADSPKQTNIPCPWTCSIYAGPSTQYSYVGSVSSGETITIISEFNISYNHFYLIEYYVGNTGIKKSGYVLAGLSI